MKITFDEAQLKVAKKRGFDTVLQANLQAFKTDTGLNELQKEVAEAMAKSWAREATASIVNKLLVKFDSFIAECKTYEDDDFMEGQCIGAASMKAYCAQLLDELAE